MTENHRVFVSADRKMLVQLWEEDERAQAQVEVATRPHPDAVWGPPVLLAEEKS
jgi:hypothetical protein